MGLGPDDLVMCAGTLASTPLPERIAVSAEAGFRGVSLFLDDLERARADGHSDADLRAMLGDRGLEVAELDPLLSWAPGTEPGGSGFDRWGEDDFYAAADALGARSINAVLFAPGPFSEEGLVDAFGALCERALQRDLLVHLEFMPFSHVRSIDAALSIVEKAGQANGGIMFDVWHHLRGGGSADSLRRAAARVTAIQLDDAPRQAEKNLIDETLHRRLLPGEGDAGVADLMRILDDGGCRAPVGVEVFSDELASRPAADVAREVGDATRRVLSAARGG